MSKFDKGIDEANKIGNLFNSWIRIAIIFGGAIISCSIAYYKIFENEKDIALEKKERIEHSAVAKDRNDKRYEREMENAKEFKEFIKYQDARILELEKKQAYLEGYIKGKEHNEKK